MKNFICLFFLIPTAWTLELKYFGAKTFDRKASFRTHQIGGLSGAFYEKGTLYAVSDDRGKYGKPRIHLFKVDLKQKKDFFEPSGVILLKNFGGTEFKNGDVDFEGIAKLSSGNLFLSSEGDNEMVPRLPPEIFEFTIKGLLVKRHSFPERFVPHPTGMLTRGVQTNLAFESFTSDFQRNSFISATEAPIVQDILPGNRQFLRLINLIYQEGTIQGSRESFYPIDIMDGNNGLVELLDIGNDQLLALERSWDPKTKINTIKVYSIEMDYETITNYRDLPSVRNQPIKPLRKKLLFDLNTVLKAGSLKRLDNFEAMLLGPKLLNGNRSLILISDNNFSIRQKTIFLVFELLK